MKRFEKIQEFIEFITCGKAANLFGKGGILQVTFLDSGNPGFYMCDISDCNSLNKDVKFFLRRKYQGISFNSGDTAETFKIP